MSDDLVEKVARAMCCGDAACYNESNGVSCSAGAHEMAAIRALRVVREALAEPDDPMQQAGAEANDRYVLQVAPCSAMRGLDAWRAMLAASPLGRVE